MTTDKNRAAFEKWCMSRSGAQMNLNKDEAGYLSDQTHEGWIIWQAASDRYAPKLTEAQAVEAAFKAFVEDTARNGRSTGNLREHLKASLRAAAVRFKEEA